MPRLFSRRKKALTPSKASAKSPHILSDGPPKITVIDYDAAMFEEKVIEQIEEVYHYRETDTVSWINVDGWDVDVIEQIDAHFGVHPLVLEDIFNVGQRPKREDFGDYLFICLHVFSYDEEVKEIKSEQISLILGKNYLLSVQEDEGDIFGTIRERLRSSKGRLRQMKADYLCYALIDAIVDNYFVVLEKLGGRIDWLETEMMSRVTADMPRQIHTLKMKVGSVRRQMWPLREVIGSLYRDELKLIDKSTQVYFRDIYDHTTQVNDLIEAFRDSLSSMHDIYLSTLSNRMNEIMKVLTIFTAIFIPLTFLAGVYGMNFDYLPELHWRYGYHFFWLLIGMIFSLMVFYFKKRKWL